MTDAQLLALARDRFKQAADATAELRELALDDLRFVSGEQWPDGIRRQRDQDGRPCLTINRLPAFIKQVVNDQRQNRPSIKISPVDDQGDPDTAEIIAGLCRHIEANSAADVAYDTAFESAVRCGVGYFRILTEYTSPESFEQEIVIRRIRNAFAVYMDPTAQQPDYSDAKWAFVVEDLTREVYKAAYPDSELASLAAFEGVGNRAPGWITPAGVRVAEYFWLEERPVRLALLETGEVMPAASVPPGALVVRERDAMQPQVRWAKINGIEVLERRDWPGRYIPIVPVLGDEAEVDGKIVLSSLIRPAKDSQRMYNYWASAETEAIALAPKAPFIVAEGQIEGYESDWQAANVKNLPYLTYKPQSVGGAVLGAPQRQTAEPAIQAISHARLMSADDIKATTGLYDASLGARSNEQSGRAIMARQREGDNATFHFQDNLARSIRHCGRIILSLIPTIYDTARIVRIVGLDGEAESVQINAPTKRGGVERVFDVTTGLYDVVVATGPSYTTKREQSVAAMLELAKAYPPLMELAGDLVVKAMDWPGSEALAERLQAALPPELRPQDDEQGGPNPQQMQQAMQAMSQQHEQLTATVNQLQDQIDAKQAELESREKIAAMQEETKRMIALAQLNHAEGMQILRNELDAIKLDAQHRHQSEIQAGQQMHQQGLQESQQQAAAEMAEQKQKPAQE